MSALHKQRPIPLGTALAQFDDHSKISERRQSIVPGGLVLDPFACLVVPHQASGISLAPLSNQVERKLLFWLKIASELGIGGVSVRVQGTKHYDVPASADQF
jgi:hypothetical protein